MATSSLGYLASTTSQLSRVSSAPACTPSTSNSQSTGSSTVTPSPGQWRHPQLTEITRRQRERAFTNANVRTILWNFSAFLTLWALRSGLQSFTPALYDFMTVPFYNMAGSWPLFIFHAILVYNVGYATLPLFRGKDNLLDIDLTASQRSLLGLDPNATPPTTPSTKYVTPPRYQRSSTPRSGTPGSRGSSKGGSPLSRQGSPSIRQSGDSPFAPLGTPLQQRAIRYTESRRHSYGFSTSSVPGNSGRDLSVFAPNTSSPTGRGSGVPLCNRWLYERGRSNSGSRALVV